MGLLGGIAAGVGGFFDSVTDKATDLGHSLTGTPTADEKRASQKLIRDQMSAYKEQTELTRKQLNDTRNEVNSEKRKVQEKQIRSLRRGYSSHGTGMLGVSEPAATDMTNTLGG